MNAPMLPKKFVKGGISHDARRKVAVVYTRVSSKEQADHNLSLEFQRKTIDEYVNRNDFQTLEYFGGTYESAKTDGRKEFQRMLEYIKKNKGRVSHILVYTLDRFSRSGGGAIKLAEDLREKYGVEVFAVTQPADTSNASGVMQQSMHFVFSKYDNELRRQRIIAGVRESLLRGIWCLRPPCGYDVIRKNGVRSIVVNEEGKKLRKAFAWKHQGMKNEQIIGKLQAMSVNMYAQKWSQTLDNPFYCGLITHSLLEGVVVEGTHEKLISYELFLAINEARSNCGGKLGVPHCKENEHLPLKSFVYCDVCRRPFAGYLVKAKGLYYYKCPTTGCKCNKSAKALNENFLRLLEKYMLPTDWAAPLLQIAKTVFDQHRQTAIKESQLYQSNLKKAKQSIEKLEERYFIGNEMPKAVYERLRGKLEEEVREIDAQMQNAATGSSNL